MLRLARVSPINLINKCVSAFTWKPGKTKYLCWVVMKADVFSSQSGTKSLIDGKGKGNGF